MKKHIYLIGFMGTGKSTISKQLHKLLGLTEVDMDALIEQEQKMKITEIFAQHGEGYFRQVETECLRNLSKEEAGIISCGGGCVLRKENVDIMRETGSVVLLTATPETVYHRVKHSNNRPILNGNMNVEYIGQLMEKRREAYEAAASCTVKTDGKNPLQIAEEIIAFYSTLC